MTPNTFPTATKKGFITSTRALCRSFAYFRFVHLPSFGEPDPICVNFFYCIILNSLCDGTKLIVIIRVFGFPNVICVRRVHPAVTQFVCIIIYSDAVPGIVWTEIFKRVLPVNSNRMQKSINHVECFVTRIMRRGLLVSTLKMSIGISTHLKCCACPNCHSRDCNPNPSILHINKVQPHCINETMHVAQYHFLHCHRNVIVLSIRILVVVFIYYVYITQ